MYINSKILSKESEEATNQIITKYLAELEDNPIRGDLDCISSIYIISELYDFFDNQKKWLDILARVLKKLNLLFYNNYYSLSSFTGVTAICHALSCLTRKTNTFFSVKKQMDNVLIELADQYIDYCCSAESISVSHYDMVSGLSGVLNYLSDLECLAAKEVMRKIIEYFVQYLEEYEFNGVLVPKWYIRPEQLIHYGKENFPEGNMDFGLAHGIAGPMMSLSKIYSKNKDIRIFEILKQLIALYSKFKFMDDGIAYWPAHLSLESYRNSEVKRNEVVFAPSWCYGNWTESLALKNAAVCVGDYEVSKFATRNLHLCCKKDVKYFEPVVCHGYGGNIIILTKTSRNELFFKSKINLLTQKILEFYDPHNSYFFSGLEDTDSILTGCGGVILSLICALKGSSCLYDVLMLNCGKNDE